MLALIYSYVDQINKFPEKYRENLRLRSKHASSYLKIAILLFIISALPIIIITAKNSQDTRQYASEIAPPTVIPAPIGIIQIMPLGDSITQGTVPGGYRLPLWNLLTANGFSVDFVGSQTTSPSTLLPDNNHEGHGSFTTSMIQDGIDRLGWIETYQPSVVLLLIGTNDLMALRVNNAMQYENTGKLIDSIFVKAPNTRIILANIPPRADDTTGIISSFNATLPSLVASKGNRVTLADMNSVLTLTDIGTDGIHPNQTGYDKMASVWEKAIKQIYGTDPLPTSTPTPTPQPLYRATWGTSSIPSAAIGFTIINPTVTVTNTSNFNWQSLGSKPVYLSYHWYKGACPFVPQNLVSPWDRERSSFLGEVIINSSQTINTTVTTPSAKGIYCLTYDLVREGVAWFSGLGSPVLQQTVSIVSTLNPNPEYSVVWISSNTPQTIKAKEIIRPFVALSNNGSLNWTTSGNNPFVLSYHWYKGPCPSAFSNLLTPWDRERTPLPSSVAPGASTALLLTVTAPATPGTYCLNYDMLHDRIAWFSGKGSSLYQKTIAVVE